MSLNKYKKIDLINIATKNNIPIKNRQKKIKTKAELYNSLKKYLIKGGNNTSIPQWILKYQKNNIKLYEKLTNFFTKGYLEFTSLDSINFTFSKEDLMKLTKMERYILYLFYTGVFDKEISKFKNKQNNNYKQDKLKYYLILIYIKTEENHKRNMSYKRNIKKESNNIKVLKINSDFINSIHEILNNKSSNISSSLTGSCLNKIRLRIDNVHNLFKEEVICLKEKEDLSFFYKLDIDSITFNEIFKIKIFENIKKLKLGDVFKIDITKEFNIELIDFSLFDKNQIIDTSFTNRKLENLINIKPHFLDNIKIITQNINFINLEKTNIRFYLEYFYGIVFNNCKISGISFNTCYLPYSTLLNTQFNSLYFKSCILEYSKFENSILNKAIFREVILSNVIIYKSIFNYSHFIKEKPNNYIFKNSIINKSTFNFTNFDGTSRIFGEDKYVIDNCKFKENKFLTCYIHNVVFINCNFIKCDFENCLFTLCDFKKCELDNCKFTKDKNESLTDLNFETCEFNNIEFKNINFSKFSNFFDIDLKNTKFIGEIIRSKGLFEQCTNIPDNIKIVVKGNLTNPQDLFNINSLNLKLDVKQYGSRFYLLINLRNINNKNNLCNNNIFSIINRIDEKYLDSKHFINFKINDQTGIDSGGITKIVFDNYYTRFLSKFFIYDSDNEFVILKNNINKDEFKKCLKKLYLLKLLVDKKNYSDSDTLKIFIPLKDDLINIFSALSKYCRLNLIINNKENKNEIKSNILKYVNKEINLKNNKKYFKKGNFDIRNYQEYMNLSNQMIKINNKNYNFKNLNKNSNEDKKKIYFSVFLKTLGFEDFDHFINNYIWYVKNWNNYFYTNKIDFSEKSFIERIEISLGISSFDPDLNLDNFINDFDKLLKSVRSYPNLGLFLKFIKESDENRQKFNSFITGSKFQNSTIKIYVDKNSTSTNPVKVATCFNKMTIYNNYKKLTYEQLKELIDSQINTINIRN